MSNDQKSKHLPEHKTLTPYQFLKEESFRNFASTNGRAKTVDASLSFQRIFLKPEPHTRIKDDTKGKKKLALPHIEEQEQILNQINKKVKRNDTNLTEHEQEFFYKKTIICCK